MKIYMIRHGETDWNKKRKLQGQVDIPLNEFGRLLARQTAPALKDIPFDAVYTSPLQRAKETAELVIGDRNIPLIEEDRLKEMGFGEFEGMCCSEEGWNIPDPDFHNFFDAPQNYQPPKGGESFQELTRRLNSFLQELIQKSEMKEKTVLLSTHGAALCGLLHLIKGNPIEKYWDGGVHKNCAVTIAEEKNGNISILEEAVTYYKESVSDW